jgi:plasmid stabilization system protein ParE
VQILWTKRALFDTERLCLILAQYDRDAATRLAIRLDAAPRKLSDHPRYGERVESYIVKEVRKLSVGRYIMHYQIIDDQILILRIWHSREDRSFGES